MTESTPATGEAWEVEHADTFVQVGDYAVTTISSNEAGAPLDVMAAREDGSVLWRSTVPIPSGSSINYHAVGSAAYSLLEDDGDVVLVSYQVTTPASGVEAEQESWVATAYDMATGEMRWTSDIHGAPLTLAGGYLIADHAELDNPTVYSATTGSHLWSVAADKWDEAVFAGAAGDRLYLEIRAADGPWIQALDLATGDQAWATNPVGGLTGTGLAEVLAVTDDTVLLQQAQNNEAHMVLRDANSGGQHASHALPPAEDALIDSTTNTAVVYSETRQAFAASSGIASIDLTGGQLLWRLSAEQVEQAELSVAAAEVGHLWLANAHGFVVSDIRDGPGTADPEVNTAPEPGSVIFDDHTTDTTGEPIPLSGL